MKIVLMLEARSGRLLQRGGNDTPYFICDIACEIWRICFRKRLCKSLEARVQSLDRVIKTL